MNLRFLVQLVLFFAVIFFGTGLLLSMAGEAKTYGIKCQFVTQDGNVKNGKVYVTTGKKCHDDFPEDALRISQYLPDNGAFYRNVNGHNGDNVSLWVEFEGHTVLHTCKSLNYSSDIIDFGQITVPLNGSMDEGSLPVIISNQTCSLQEAQREMRKVMGSIPQQPANEVTGSKVSIGGH